MTGTGGASGRVPRGLDELVSSAPFAQAFALCAIGTTFSIPLIRNLLGWPGVVGALCTLVVLAAVVLIGRRHYIEWRGWWPLSIFAFVAWCALSMFWSDYTTSGLIGLGYQVVVVILAMTIALTRDMIQIVRAVGGVLRLLLAVSIGLEMLSGIFFDVPIPFLSIEGNIALGGPIQGIFVTRNLLGLMAVIGLITFVIEWRTHSVDRPLAIGSIALAVLCLLLSQSPINQLLILVVLVATLALLWLRKSSAERRTLIQAFLLTVGFVGFVAVYIARNLIIRMLDAGSEFGVRYHLWRATWDLVKDNFLEGWGWIGSWRDDTFPYILINIQVDRVHASALNAYLDVYLQVGLVGIFLFLVLCLFAFLRSWNLASNRRSLIYTWPALVLVTLLAGSSAESHILTGAGWFLLVICAAKASQSQSWRQRIDKRPAGPSSMPLNHPDQIP
ncbi:O-antigen ligase [Microbacterium sp. MPKO10]|uniref:O-antigen ligase family protein n=1 Tax=Microbacterium sp. MPKO10 TaxID=2989818 RepID=UPI0022357AC0|nr:O-antigen ligase family protein [Microbacterium sp. MPKO10]MCW4457829.1 O-antigen ligase family protein [Microbacterium sp. MPKO10]